MDDAPYGLALAAGALAAVNPCGFALLPAYLTFLVLGPGGETGSRRVAVLRALLLTGAMTLGFAAVFGLFGLVVAPVAGSIQQHLPWFTIGLGLLLALLGGWLLAGRELPGLRLPRFGGGAGGRAGRGGPVGRSAPAMVAFGASYAVASLGCTIGPFLAIVVASFQSRSVLAGVGLFVTYAIGMGLLVGVAALAVSFTRTALIGRLRRHAALGSRVGGALLVVVGAYVAYYGWYEIRVLSGAEASDPLIAAVETVQAEVAAFLDRLFN